MHPLYDKLIYRLSLRQVNLSELENDLIIPKNTLYQAVKGRRKIPKDHIEKLIKHLKIE